jgi:hypothetical protein
VSDDEKKDQPEQKVELDRGEHLTTVAAAVMQTMADEGMHLDGAVLAVRFADGDTAVVSAVAKIGQDGISSFLETMREQVPDFCTQMLEKLPEAPKDKLATDPKSKLLN